MTKKNDSRRQLREDSVKNPLERSTGRTAAKQTKVKSKLISENKSESEGDREREKRTSAEQR